MTDFSKGFKGYERAEDIHGQIRLCKGENLDMLHLKNMNFNFACSYTVPQAKEVKKILDREGVKALSLWVSEETEPSAAVELASVYGVEYIVAENEETKNRLLASGSSFTVITEEET